MNKEVEKKYVKVSKETFDNFLKKHKELYSETGDWDTWTTTLYNSYDLSFPNETLCLHTTTKSDWKTTYYIRKEYYGN